MDHLINLVRSLSPKEKNQFVKYARQYLSHKEAKKVTLFQLIARQLRGQLKDYRALAQKQFSPASLPSLKTQLYNQLLTSLSINSVKTARSQTSRMIDEIQVLIDRGLLRQALMRIEKAKKIIEENHLHFQYLELSLLYRRIIRQYKTRDVIDLLEQEQQACEKHIQWITDEFELLEEYESHFIQSRLGGGDPTQSLPRPKQEVEDVQSLEGKIYYHLLQRQYYRNQKNPADKAAKNQKIYEATKAIVQLFEDHPSFLADKLPRYFRAVTNHLNACMNQGNFDEVEQKIELIRQVRTQSFYEEAQKQSTLLSEEIILYYHLNQFEKVYSMIDRAWNVLEKYKVFISFERLLGISNNMGVCLFLGHKLDEAWEFFNFCLQKQDYSELKEKVVGKNFGKFVQASAHIYRLMVIYSLNKEDEYTPLLKSFVASADNFLTHNKFTTGIFWELFSSLKTIINRPGLAREKLLALRPRLEGQAAYKGYLIWIDRVLEG